MIEYKAKRKREMYIKTLEFKRTYLLTTRIVSNYPFGLNVKVVVDDNVIYETDLDLNNSAKNCALEASQQLQNALISEGLHFLSDEEENAWIKFLEVGHSELLEEWKRLYDFDN